MKSLKYNSRTVNWYKPLALVPGLHCLIALSSTIPGGHLQYLRPHIALCRLMQGSVISPFDGSKLHFTSPTPQGAEGMHQASLQHFWDRKDDSDTSPPSTLMGHGGCIRHIPNTLWDRGHAPDTSSTAHGTHQMQRT